MLAGASALTHCDGTAGESDSLDNANGTQNGGNTSAALVDAGFPEGSYIGDGGIVYGPDGDVLWMPDGGSMGATDAGADGESHSHGGMDGAVVIDYESIRNTNPAFRKHRNDTQAQIDALGFSSNEFTTAVMGNADNGPGPGGQGQFRVLCQYSHFGNNDPIVFPGKPGMAHLHMFWGNTDADAYTKYNNPSTSGDKHDILEFGGGTCQGFELNRSSYWVPAMTEKSTGVERAVVPYAIVLYYKSYVPSQVHPMPQGLEMLSGNVKAGGSPGASFTWNDDLLWSCGVNGSPTNKQSTIPTNCGNTPINAQIHFPNCLKVDAKGNPVLSSPDHLSHTYLAGEPTACPASHPYRIPTISYLLYWKNGTDGNGAGVSTWRLSSDTTTPGGSLHGDWLGGWNKKTAQNWIDGCFDPSGNFSGPRNCSIGQTGQNKLNRTLSRVDDFAGDPFLVLPTK